MTKAERESLNGAILVILHKHANGPEWSLVTEVMGQVQAAIDILAAKPDRPALSPRVDLQHLYRPVKLNDVPWDVRSA